MLKHTTLFTEDRRSERGEMVRFGDLEVGACFTWHGYLFQKIETFNSEFEAIIFSSGVGFYDVDDDDLVEFVPAVRVSMQSTVQGGDRE